MWLNYIPVDSPDLESQNKVTITLKIFNTNDNTPLRVHHTHLLNFVLFHVRYKLKQKPRYTEQEIKGLVNYQGAPCCNLKLCVIIQHVVPSIF